MRSQKRLDALEECFYQRPDLFPDPVVMRQKAKYLGLSAWKRPCKTVQKYIGDRNDFSLKASYLRDYFIKDYAFSVPCKEAIDFIKKYSTGMLIDPIAGTGYWAYVLNLAGIKTLAFDKVVSGENIYGQKQYRDQPITKQRAYHTMLKLGTHDILLSWPPYSDPLGASIVRRAKGNVFYIGEGESGCCGDDEMFKLFEKHFDKIAELDLPQFRGLHDYLTLYRRKNLTKSQSVVE